MVKNELIVILVKYGFITLLQRIFNCDKIQYINITPDTVLNSLVYGSPFCVIIYTSYKLSKMVELFMVNRYFRCDIVSPNVFTQRIFKYDDIPNISFTPDNELNISIYWTPSYLIIYRSHTLLKWSNFLPTLYIAFLPHLAHYSSLAISNIAP